MEFPEYCTEGEEQNGCTGTEWVSAYRLETVVVAWLTGTMAASARHHERRLSLMQLAQEKIAIQNRKYSRY